MGYTVDGDPFELIGPWEMCNFANVFFKLILRIDILSNSCETAQIARFKGPT